MMLIIPKTQFVLEVHFSILMTKIIIKMIVKIRKMDQGKDHGSMESKRGAISKEDTHT